MWRGTGQGGRGRSFQLSMLIVSLMYKISFTGKKTLIYTFVSIIVDVLTNFSTNSSNKLLVQVLEREWVGEKKETKSKRLRVCNLKKGKMC